MQKILFLSGLVLILIALLLPWLSRLGIGHLPGDMIFKRGDMTFYFPLTTCILASLILTLLIRLLSK